MYSTSSSFYFKITQALGVLFVKALLGIVAYLPTHLPFRSKKTNGGGIKHRYVYGSGDLDSNVLETLGALYDEQYKSGNAYLEYVWSMFRQPSIEYTSTDLVPTSDNEIIAIDWIAENMQSDTVVIIMPGYGSGADFHYHKHWDKIAETHGWSCCVLTRRGHDDRTALKSTLSALPSYSDVLDVDCAIEHIRSKNKNASEDLKIHLVGYSAGSNHAFKYASIPAYAAKIKSVVGISCILDLRNYIDYVRQHPILDGLLFAAFRHIIRRNQLAYMAKGVDVDRVLKSCGSIYEFEDHLSVMTGYEDIGEKFTSQTANLEYVKVPVLIISSQDDFFLSPRTFELYEEITAKKKDVHVLMTKYGSHLAWRNSLMNYAVADYIHLRNV